MLTSEQMLFTMALFGHVDDGNRHQCDSPAHRPGGQVSLNRRCRVIQRGQGAAQFGSLLRAHLAKLVHIDHAMYLPSR